MELPGGPQALSPGPQDETPMATPQDPSSRHPRDPHLAGPLHFHPLCLRGSAAASANCTGGPSCPAPGRQAMVTGSCVQIPALPLTAKGAQ